MAQWGLYIGSKKFGVSFGNFPLGGVSHFDTESF